MSSVIATKAITTWVDCAIFGTFSTTVALSHRVTIKTFAAWNTCIALFCFCGAQALPRNRIAAHSFTALTMCSASLFVIAEALDALATTKYIAETLTALNPSCAKFTWGCANL